MAHWHTHHQISPVPSTPVPNSLEVPSLKNCLVVVLASCLSASDGEESRGSLIKLDFHDVVMKRDALAKLPGTVEKMTVCRTDQRQLRWSATNGLRKLDLSSCMLWHYHSIPDMVTMAQQLTTLKLNDTGAGNLGKLACMRCLEML